MNFQSSLYPCFIFYKSFVYKGILDILSRLSDEMIDQDPMVRSVFYTNRNMRNETHCHSLPSLSWNRLLGSTRCGLLISGGIACGGCLCCYLMV